MQEGTTELDLSNILCVSVDGPNVNWKFVELLQEEHREQCPKNRLLGVVAFTRCTARARMALRCGKLRKYPEPCTTCFIVHLARREDFMLVTKCGTFPQPFCGHHYLENLPAVERTIEIWPYTVTYVDQVKAKKLPNPRSSPYDTIADAQMDPIILAKLHFFMSVSRGFQQFLAKYQRDAPMIPFLCKDLEDLIRVGLMTTINVLKWFSRSSTINYRGDEQLNKVMSFQHVELVCSWYCKYHNTFFQL